MQGLRGARRNSSGPGDAAISIRGRQGGVDVDRVLHYLSAVFSL